MKTGLGIAAFFILYTVLVQACVIQPQQQATVTPSPVPTATETLAPTPTITLTPWEPVEVTPIPTPSIIEIGTPFTGGSFPYNDPQKERGQYTSWAGQRRRDCPSTTCAPIQPGLAAGKTYDTQGLVREIDNRLWVCFVIEEDIHGAKLCTEAALYYDPAEGYLGTYVRIDNAEPTETSSP